MNLSINPQTHISNFLTKENPCPNSITQGSFNCMVQKQTGDSSQQLYFDY
ncbi:unnamed protein product [Moneuplotes crassus]|uniref:Uncharacterized protein n=1 Tax=Euplotes crassus TaxID=5936 RepID=A0AAD1XKU7_EUPCR|nr:unnamed protein product [Moneuplotes crassus]